MKLHEAISEVLDSGKSELAIRRDSWTHGDSLIVANAASYMGGELYYKISGKRASLFYIDDIISDDWNVE